MDLNGLREAIRKHPFEPFQIRLADGRSLSVPHPELLAVGQRRAVLIQDDDSCLWIEPLLIVSIDWPCQEAPKKNGNGSHKRRKPRE